MDESVKGKFNANQENFIRWPAASSGHGYGPGHFPSSDQMHEGDAIEVLYAQEPYYESSIYNHWYKKSAELMEGTDIRAALVSTNSVTQGEAVANLWKPLFAAGVHFDFAYRIFRWNSESNSKAHVHCVIVGFSTTPNSKERVIYTDSRPNIVKNINGYLLNADSVSIESRQKPICSVPEIGIGNKPILLVSGEFEV